MGLEMDESLSTANCPTVLPTVVELARKASRVVNGTDAPPGTWQLMHFVATKVATSQGRPDAPGCQVPEPPPPPAPLV
jgi:hypothetical protein